MASPRTLQQACRRTDIQAAGGRQSRIFSKRMPGNERNAGSKIKAARLQNPHRGQADGHQCRLGIGRQGQRVVRPVPT